ncbi:hypothetical protein ACIRG5_19885 [Lentzea sp. NPDC102401]|uniref:hypothetical protein n=1 Tax=Lentzea sp. NPDC102401 TaxID=3364128 RepID=UPI00380F3336
MVDDRAEVVDQAPDLRRSSADVVEFQASPGEFGVPAQQLVGPDSLASREGRGRRIHRGADLVVAFSRYGSRSATAIARAVPV